MQNGGKSTSIATGCFKCGRPGHWSRDCSFSNLPPAAAVASNNSTFKAGDFSTPNVSSNPVKASTQAPPKLPRVRPKLTPQLLLSDAGLGYVLEKFPQIVKYRGTGHEVEDLKNLIEAYMHWHSRLLPYFTFDQFVEKVEKASGSKNVRMCIREMREKVQRGDELKVQNNSEGTSHEDCGTSLEVPQSVADNAPREGNLDQQQQAFPEPDEYLVEDFFKKATDEPLLGEMGKKRSREEMAAGIQEFLPTSGSGPSVLEVSPNTAQTLKAEHMLRMETNRLKALERVKTRLASS